MVTKDSLPRMLETLRGSLPNRHSGILVGLSGFIVFLLLISGYIWQVGQSPLWDTRNYHFYGVYRLLHGGMVEDILPAQQQQFFNPLPYSYYYGAYHVPVLWLKVLIFALPPALALWVTGVAFLQVIKSNKLDKWIFTAAVVAMAASSPFFLEMAGSWSLGHFSAFMVVMGVIGITKLLSASDGMGLAKYYLLLAGLCVGAAAGAKLTNGPFLVGVGVTVPLLAERLKTAFFWAGWTWIGAAVGFVLLGGWWHGMLWSHYGNPVLPYFNDVFNSDFVSEFVVEGNPGVNENFPSVNLPGLISRPIEWILGGVGKDNIRDVRWAVAAALTLMYFLVRGWQVLPVPHAGRRLSTVDKKIVALSLAAAISYAAWYSVFRHERYLLPGTLIVTILLGAVVHELQGLRVRGRLLLMGLVTAVVIQTSVADGRGRLSWSLRWANISQALVVEGKGTVVLMDLGGMAASFLVNGFPPETQFVRTNTNMSSNGRTHPFDDLIEPAMRRAEQLYVIKRPGKRLSQAGEDILANIGARIVQDSCSRFNGEWKHQEGLYELCAIERVDSF